MKARFIRECPGPGVMHQIGEEIEHRQAWILCLPGFRNEPPKAEPIDEECRRMVEKGLTTLNEKIAQMKAMLRNPPEKVLYAGVDAVRELRDTAVSWDIYDGELDDLIDMMGLQDNAAPIIEVRPEDEVRTSDKAD